MGPFDITFTLVSHPIYVSPYDERTSVEKKGLLECRLDCIWLVKISKSGNPSIHIRAGCTKSATICVQKFPSLLLRHCTSWASSSWSIQMGKNISRALMRSTYLQLTILAGLISEAEHVPRQQSWVRKWCLLRTCPLPERWHQLKWDILHEGEKVIILRREKRTLGLCTSLETCWDSSDGCWQLHLSMLFMIEIQRWPDKYDHTSINKNYQICVWSDISAIYYGV